MTEEHIAVWRRSKAEDEVQKRRLYKDTVWLLRVCKQIMADGPVGVNVLVKTAPTIFIPSASKTTSHYLLSA